MIPTDLLDTGFGLLRLLANVARAAGEDDVAEALEAALVVLADKRARIAADRAGTDAALEELRRKEQGG